MNVLTNLCNVSNRGRSLVLLLIALGGGLALLAGGCAQQDLYEPPGSPYTLVGQLALPSFNEDVTVIGNVALVAGGQAGMHTIDISDPQNPVLLSTTDTDRYCFSVEIVRVMVEGNIYDVAHPIDGTEGIGAFDVTDPYAVTDLFQASNSVFGKNFTIVQEDPYLPYYVFMCDTWSGVQIFEWNGIDPGLFTDEETTRTRTQGEAEAAAYLDGWLYVADDGMGLAVLDARELEPGLFRQVAWADSPGSALDVVCEPGYAYIADGLYGLQVYAIDGGEPPVLVAGIDLSGYSRSIALRDDLLALAAGVAGTHFVDISDPENPVYLGSYVSTYSIGVEFAANGLCLVADQEDGLLVLGGRSAFDDVEGPAQVGTLAATPLSRSLVELSWSTTGDDGLFGRAASQEIRYASDPIDEDNWNAATVLDGVPSPETAGTKMVAFLDGTDPETDYHFSMRVTDDRGQVSPLSSSVSATTLPGFSLQEPSASPATGFTFEPVIYSVVYYFDNEPTVTEVVIDGATTLNMSEAGSGPYGHGTRYTVSTFLNAGEHSYHLHFEAADVDSVTTEEFFGPVLSNIVFTMGSPEGELGRGTDETLHEVALSDSLYFSPHEVTQDEWEAVGLTDPSEFDGGNRPVDSVTWYEAVEYCNLRSAAETPPLQPAYDINGFQVTWNRQADGWRLPTEAEWEWLCRAESDSAFYNGGITEVSCRNDSTLAAIGWYCANAGAGTHPVEQKTANAFGLHDMAGNVWEWCWDWYEEDLGSAPVFDPIGPAGGQERVRRGGGWFNAAQDCRSANRGKFFPDYRDNTNGLRVVRNKTPR